MLTFEFWFRTIRNDELHQSMSNRRSDVAMCNKSCMFLKVHFVSSIPPLGLATYTIEEQSSAESHSSVSLYHFVGDVMME